MPNLHPRDDAETADGDRASQRPTVPTRSESGVRWKAGAPAAAPVSTPEPRPRSSRPAIRDLGAVPLVVDRRPLEADPPRPLIATLLTAMNGVLSLSDLAEITGIPRGALLDTVADLEQRGVLVLLRRR